MWEPTRSRARKDFRIWADGTLASLRPGQRPARLFNLVTNALRHTPTDGSVALRVAPGKREVVVAVEDTGFGFAPEAAGRAFDRFWRGDRARTRAHAWAGLGVAIARGLVEAQGGLI